MENKIIEDMFVDFILEKLGPSNEKDEIINKVLNDTKKNILSYLKEEQEYLDIHIIPFGSFPTKLYISESDLDVTVMFFNKQEKTQYEYDFEFLNKVLHKIQIGLEQDKEVSGVSLIFADVKIIKCKRESIPIDISIGNYVGLCKLSFMNILDKEIFKKESRIKLFKRTLILLKAWCSAESYILGSNISLMASYALECLTIYLFNFYSDSIASEFDGFCKFFEVMSEIKWETEIVTIFGLLSNDDFSDNSDYYDDYLVSFYRKNNGFIFQDKIINLSKQLAKYKDSDKTQVFSSNKKIINLKYINIIDPLFNSNNLGKSVNYYNFCKIKKVFEMTNSRLLEIKSIFKGQKDDTNEKLLSPVNYLNTLLGLFERSLVEYYPELFYQSLIKAKIVLDLSKEENKLYIDDVKTIVINNPESGLNTTLVEDFNLKFRIGKGVNFFDIGNIAKETKGSNVELNINSKSQKGNKELDCNYKKSLGVNLNGSLYLTKEILDVFVQNLEYNTAFKVYKNYECDKDLSDLVNKIVL